MRTAKGWSRKFDEPIPLPRGRELITLKDAGNYITKLPKTEHEAPEWQAATQALILVATNGGPTLLARIGVMRALNRHPRMMVALLLHGYASGLYSSRRIARACRERSDFVMIVALDPPDFRTISDFRKRHLKALGALFLQVLKLRETAGLVKLGHVALDGTKIKANASKHKAMSYERMKATAFRFGIAPPERRPNATRPMRNTALA